MTRLKKFYKERYSLLSYTLIVVFSIIPLFFNFPFRDNSYLSWEGAYRMYKGQFPFVDFGLPLGYGFWLFPTLSFYLFGPYFFSLIKIQVIVNIISGVTFKGMADLFVKNKAVVFLSVFLYCLTYIFINFWPWYNHVVVVYEFIGLYFLLLAIVRDHKVWIKYLLVFLSALFVFLSVFTKQDAGGLAIFTSGLILIHQTIVSRRFDFLVSYPLSFIIILTVFVLPLLKHDFLYWFNYGQEHHYSRINLLDFAQVIFGKSQFLKLYLLVIVLVLVYKFKSYGWKWVKGKEGLFALLTICILFQASIIQVTSYIPPDVNIYFHSFFVLFVLYSIADHIDLGKVWYVVMLSMLILFWWSGYYWRYSSRIFARLLPEKKSENVVSISSWTKKTDTIRVDMSTWGYSTEKEFERIRMPQEAIEAVERLKDWRDKSPGEIKVLNMSELTPLANILDFELERGMPLWYHLNVAMFDRELNVFLDRIEEDYYDLVIFEYLQGLNNFYPFEVREKLQEEYDFQFSFQAPREYKFEVIEVYQPKNAKTKISQLD